MRSDGAINRLCAAPNGRWTACPNSQYSDDIDSFDGQMIVNTTIPEQTSTPFSSGTRNTTICGPMDIQFRNYFTQSNDDYINGGNPHLRGDFLPFDTFLLASDYQLIEGR